MASNKIESKSLLNLNLSQIEYKYVNKLMCSVHNDRLRDCWFTHYYNSA